MSQNDKLVGRLLDSEQYKNLTFEELRHLLLQCGFHERIGGADYVFKHPKLARTVMLPKPHGRESRVKFPYIRRVREALQAVECIKSDEEGRYNGN
jgi:predicted RNA binding protein YcfA (HicA-like mRNA interferase family)